jgi:hypothetical protein
MESAAGWKQMLKMAESAGWKMLLWTELALLYTDCTQAVYVLEQDNWVDTNRTEPLDQYRKYCK